MKQRMLMFAVAAVALATTASSPAQPPGGGSCNPIGYTMYCRATCVFEERVGGVCDSSNENQQGTYCLEVEPRAGVCHDGSGDECCMGVPDF